MTNPLTDPYLVLIKVYKEGKYLKQAIADTPCEPLTRAATVAVCYGVLERDWYLSRIIEHNTEKSPKQAVRVVLKIALYMLEFMGKHSYMVVDNAVQLIKKLGKEKVAGFVNAFLRSYRLPPEPEDGDERTAFRCSAPLWLVRRLKSAYGEEAADILSAPSRGVCVRFERGAEKYLGKQHTDTPFDGVYIFKNFTRDSGFFSGDYTFQSVGSVAVASAISPCERLLDGCAAPGGKSVLLSKCCALVTACELHPHRAELIRAYAERMGRGNIEIEVADSSIFKPEYEGLFDGALVDAPCSGTGVINENPDIKLNRREEDIGSLTKLQLVILENCSRYVKGGGRLYYSTCSVLAEENDGVAGAFLQKHPEYASVRLSSPLGHRETGCGMQFLPHISLGAGFYMAAFERKV